MINTFKSFILLLILLVAIPIAGIITSNKVAQGYENEYESVIIKIIQENKKIDTNIQEALKKFQLDNICSNSDSDFPKELRAVCDGYQQINYLGEGSNITLLFSIFILSVIFVLSMSAKTSRKALFYLFRPGLFLTQMASVILVIANSAIIVFGIYIAESFYFGRIHIFLIGGVGLIAAYAAFLVCVKALTPIKNAESRTFGKFLSRDDSPHIWEFVDSIATRAGTNPPDTIIVGMEPNFFVTETGVTCLDGTAKGKSLYLSLPFCRALTKNELSAIIGHELGHFVGEDTMWSKKFYPIYKGAIDTLCTLYYNSTSEKDENNNALVQLAFSPALHLMSFFLNSFQAAEKTIGRTRELNADKMGVHITSPEIMAAGLLKVHIYSYAWLITQEKMKEALTAGKQITNISTFFSSICDLIPADFMKDEIGSSHTSHPTDTHPPLSTRLKSIGIQLSEIYAKGIKPPTTDIAIELISDASKIEEELSDVEHYKLAKSGKIALSSG